MSKYVTPTGEVFNVYLNDGKGNLHLLEFSGRPLDVNQSLSEKLGISLEKIEQAVEANSRYICKQEDAKQELEFMKAQISNPQGVSDTNAKEPSIFV